MSYKEIFEFHLNEYLKSTNYNKKIGVSYSDFDDFQYQTSIGLVLKKENKEFNPEEIKKFLEKNYQSFYENISVTGPGFISVKFNLLNIKNEPAKPKKVIIDYCGVNVAKQMHIGHIRSMFIGDYIVRLHEKKGDNVTILNHIGDWGNQFGYLLNYILENKLEKDLTNKNLTQYYKEATLLNKESVDFANKSAEIAYKLQNKTDKDLVKLWEKLVNISMIEADKTFKEFNLKMSLDHTQGESFYAPLCKDVLYELLNKQIAQKSEDGSVVCFFEKKSPLVLQKSNGNFLYALYDLAAIKWRAENVNPDKIVYVVDKRQALHFEQVFEIAKKANFIKPEVELLHVGFGTILGADKKPIKTKEGDSLYLDDLLSEGKEKLLKTEYFQKLNENLQEPVMMKNIIGGMKYHDLKFNKTQDYVFDWNHVLNFSGGSAPYIQNAMVRIDSIFEKLGLNMNMENSLDLDKNWNEMEKKIIFQCQKTEEVISFSENDYTSQAICENIIKICQLFHSYYEQEYIIGHKEESKKLELLNYIYSSLDKFTDVLGIESYPCQQKMLKSLDKNKQLKF